MRSVVRGEITHLRHGCPSKRPSYHGGALIEPQVRVRTRCFPDKASCCPDNADTIHRGPVVHRTPHTAHRRRRTSNAPCDVSLHSVRSPRGHPSSTPPLASTLGVIAGESVIRPVPDPGHGSAPECSWPIECPVSVSVSARGLPDRSTGSE